MNKFKKNYQEVILNSFLNNKLKESHAKFLLENTSDSEPLWREPIAVIGYSCQFPNAENAAAYWQLINNVECAITEVPIERWDTSSYYHHKKQLDKTYCKWGGFLQNPYQFDEKLFEITPLEASYMDPQARLYLQQAWMALEHSGYSKDQVSAEKIGITAGVMLNDYIHQIDRYSTQPNLAQTMQGNSNSILAARLAYCLNLKGPAIAIDTACSSSLVAIHLATQSLQLHECDVMLAGGVTLYLTEKPFIYMSQAQMLSATGQCLPFDHKANGMVVGEGAGVVVLKRLSNALEDNDYIHGIILGSGINQDGKSFSMTAPNASAQLALYQDVYRRANVEPRDIDYLECHATGTPLGDPIEMKAISDFFPDDSPLVLGGVKANIGHTSAAAGVASVIKMLLAAKHEYYPGLCQFESLNPEIIPSEHLIFNKKSLPWITKADQAKLSAVNSFGFSGTNAHLILMA